MLLDSKYEEKSSKTLTGVTYSFTDTFKNLFPLNEKIDNSIIATSLSTNLLSNDSVTLSIQLPSNVILPVEDEFPLPVRSGYKLVYAQLNHAADGAVRNSFAGYTWIGDSIFNASNTYRFNGYNADATAVKETSVTAQSKFVRDLNYSEFVVMPSIQGYTKTEYDDYINNYNDESVMPTVTTISNKDFIANPNNFYITSIGCSCYRYNTTEKKWVSSGNYLSPALVVNSKTATGILSLNNAFFTRSLNNASPASYHMVITEKNAKFSPTGGSDLYIWEDLNKSYFVFDRPTDLLNAKIKSPIPTSVIGARISEANANIASAFNKKYTYGYTSYESLHGKTVLRWSYSIAKSANKEDAYLYDLIFDVFGVANGKAVYELLAGTGAYFYWEDGNFVGNAADGNFTPDNIFRMPDIWLGEMSGTGETTGKFITGDTLKKYNGYNKDGNVSNADYNPNQISPFSAKDDVDDMKYNEVIVNTANAFRKMYAVSSDDLTTLNLALSDSSNWDESSSSEHKIPMGFDPMQSIIGLSVFPWDITTGQMSGSGISSTLQIGRWNTGISATKLVSGTTSWYDLGSIFVQPKIQDGLNGEYNFLNYAPYTQVYVYVPYCGEIELPTNLVMDHTINVRVLYDITSGSIKACIKSEGWDTTDGGIIVGEIGGQISSAMMISSQGESMRKSALISSGLTATSGVISGITGIATSNPTAAIGGAIATVGGITQTIATTNKNFSSTKGSSDPMTEFLMPNQCYLKVVYPKPVGDNSFTSAHYSRTAGAITAGAYSFNSMDGDTYYIAQNPNLHGLTATESEKQHIKAILETGFFA